ncbi:MAG TPA: hypothetical protein DEQ38_13165 [Elusimicrobia bacterium]|nr:MAG: hypothetical protein A2089_14300 [Elusimicrobia bacterium GWD2_63_28]HCC49047.1 hypothetical protein [Elusimicrobiota bacterium]
MKNKKSVSKKTRAASLESALGPLWKYYADTEVREIFINSFDKASAERKGKLEALPPLFSSRAAVTALVKNLAALPGSVSRRPGGAAGKVLELRLADLTKVTCAEGAAYQAVIISKMPAGLPGWAELVRHGCLPEEGKKLFEKILGEMKSVLVAGSNCSGKTTLMDILANGLPAGRRVVAIQGDSGLALRHPAALCLDASSDEEFVELLRSADKFLPDYLVVDSLDGIGAPEVVRAMRNGLAVIASCHAESALDALKRLEYMYLSSRTSFGLDEIRSLLASGIGYISFQERAADGKRRVTELSRLDGYEDGRYLLTPLLKYNYETGAFELTPAGKAALA